MKNDKLASLIGLSVLLASSVSGQEIISDNFDDDLLSGNTNGIGSGFSSASGSGWNEAASAVTHTGPATSGSDFSSLTSVDSFVANSAVPSETVSVSFTLSDWDRSIDDTLTTNWNARFAIGIRDSNASTSNPFDSVADGLWIGMNFDGTAGETAEGVGVAGITYINGGVLTALGDTWNWDDNGIDEPGATLVDIATSDIGTEREDRVDIAMNAPDLTITIELGQDFWSINFSSTDPSVALPPSQSGTFSEANVVNDLSTAVVAAYHQGDHFHTASFDNITVNRGAVVPSGPIVINDFSRDGDTISLTWASNIGTAYVVSYSFDLVDWDTDFDDGLIGDAGETTESFDLSSFGLENEPTLFVRVEVAPQN